MIDVVIPTIGRPSLDVLLASLARADGPRPRRVIIVDDRRDRTLPLAIHVADTDLRARIDVVRGRARGPAAARNDGWRRSRVRWIAFLDDDVIVDANWFAALNADLESLDDDVAGSTGRVRVPLPADRRPTDWERNVAGLGTARWITADCAYRRRDLLACGGFDERFPRAFREDADLALRITASGKRIVRGERGVTHPVRPAPWYVSVPLQAGNADDVLMETIHGPDWYERAGAPRGAFRSHVATVAAASLAVIALPIDRRLALLAGATWATLFGSFAWRRIAPGPRDAGEIAGLLATSAAIPFAAVYHHLRGRIKEKDLAARRGPLVGSPNRIRTGVTAVRGRRPRPLDDRAALAPGHGLEPR